MTTQPNTTVISSVVRKYILEYFEQHSSAPVLEQIMQKFKLERPAAFRSLVELESARHIALVPGTQRILMAWPFSAIATPFRVTLARNNMEYFANCAWDAVAFHVMLRKEQRIDSHCHHCAEKITVRLNNQRKISSSPGDSPLVYIGLPAAKWWENVLLTCSNNMVFFSSKEHLLDWTRSRPDSTGEALTIERSLQLSVPFYQDKMKIDYARPSRERVMSHFESLGLTGDFWRV